MSGTTHRGSRISDIPQSPRTAAAFAAATIVFLAGLRLLYLFARYILAVGNTERHHVESAAVIFVACGIALTLIRKLQPQSESNRPLPLRRWTWPLFCGLALALYWPALSVGFLSDDFVLVQRAAAWSLGPVSPTLFRPLPLFVWAVLLRAGAGAPALHLLNLLLHGTNAYLTVRILARWVDSGWALVGGLLVLSAPLDVEAVVWCSGVFDLLATSLVLICVLLAGRYRDDPGFTTRLQFFAAGIAAFASKETAVVAAAFVIVDAYVRKEISRKLLFDTSMLAGVVGGVSLWRLASVPEYTTASFGKYELQALLFQTFGSLATPWHAEVIHSRPGLPITGVVLLVYLLMVFFIVSAARRSRTLAAAAALWVLLPIVPVWATFFVSPDLQQSRYLYLSVAGWAALVVAVASTRSERIYLKVLQGAAVTGLLAISAYGIHLHLQPWIEAAAVRDQIEAAALEPEMARCRVVTVGNLPEAVRGAYVFRNGPAEAFARDLHLTAVLDNNARGECSFRWDPARGSFTQTGVLQ